MERRQVIGVISGAACTAGCAAMIGGVVNGNTGLILVGAIGAALGALALVLLYFTAPRPKAMSPEPPAAIRVKKAGSVHLKDNEHAGTLFESDETGELHAEGNRPSKEA